MTSGNMRKKKHISIFNLLEQPAFKLGVKDFQDGKSPRDVLDLPPNNGHYDTIANREIFYFRGRWAAAYCQVAGCSLTLSSMRLAFKERAII